MTADLFCKLDLNAAASKHDFQKVYHFIV